MDKGLLNRLSVSFLTLLGRKNPSDAPQTSSQTPSGELPQSEDELSGEALNGAVVLHREMSEFGEISVEEERSGVRNLVFAPGVAVQSAVIPGRPLELQLAYTRTAMAALALRPDARRILVVGLGGGAIPMFLRLALPEAVIDVAERDAAVVRIAQDFMGLRLDGHLRVRVCDGRDFMAYEHTPAAKRQKSAPPPPAPAVAAVGDDVPRNADLQPPAPVVAVSIGDEPGGDTPWTKESQPAPVVREEKRSLTWLWITLGVVAAAGIATGGYFIYDATHEPKGTGTISWAL